MRYHSDFTRSCASAAGSLWKLAGKLIGRQPPPRTLGQKVQGCGCMMIFPVFSLTLWLLKWMVMAMAALALITAATGCSLAAGVGLIVDLFPSQAKKAWSPPQPRIPPPPGRSVASKVAPQAAPDVVSDPPPVAAGPPVAYRLEWAVKNALAAQVIAGQKHYRVNCLHCGQLLEVPTGNIRCPLCRKRNRVKAPPESG